MVVKKLKEIYSLKNDRLIIRGSAVQAMVRL